MRVPERVGTSADIGLDVSWVVGLPAAFADGQISGRDFHYTYGALSQSLAAVGAWFHKPWSPLDALPLIMLAFFVAGIGLLALILLLLKQLDWKQSAFIYLCCTGLNLFSEPTSFRVLAFLTCAAVTCRALESSSRIAVWRWAAVAGITSM